MRRKVVGASRSASPRLALIYPELGGVEEFTAEAAGSAGFWLFFSPFPAFSARAAAKDKGSIGFGKTLRRALEIDNLGRVWYACARWDGEEAQFPVSWFDVENVRCLTAM